MPVSADKYPAFYFGKNYKEITGSNVSGTAYEDGWYLPTLAEIYYIYACRADTSNGFAIDAAINALGGDAFGSNEYWTASQSSDDAKNACVFSFGSGACDNQEKTSQYCACCIREF